MWRILITFLAFTLGATATLAQPYDTTRLFTRGAWYVELTHDTSDGELWCSAETRNNEAQTFSVTTYDDGAVILFVFDDRWALASRDVDFLVNIDRQRWTISGYADGIGISVTLDDKAQSDEFLVDLARGNSVSVANADGRRIAAFSLSGSSAALSTLMDCWTSILSGGSGLGKKDPF
ncbi:MAG: hypothetical protein Q8Q63_00975 [Phaeovulum sp.]|jgi:hypothetical protein|uniref:hypothetical protein n=1 Tax=Phaeovulum sp. TaxID=2934796 RepID=UPI002730F8F3|nr:hypothetical protein [Phaeovulum sp.]MDP2063815.1 hypothetical protein [Phaeovulum sp.]MDP3860141.1 hypothetical protein [Phaeovulum sp.]